VRLVQFIDFVLFSPSLSPSLPLCPAGAFPSFFPPALCRAAPRGGSRGAPMRGGGGGGRGCPGGFCPSFVSSSNYDLPHEYEPYVNTRSPLPPSSANRIPSFFLLPFASSSLFISLFSLLHLLLPLLLLLLPLSSSLCSLLFAAALPQPCPLPSYRGHHFVLPEGLQMHPR